MRKQTVLMAILALQAVPAYAKDVKSSSAEQIAENHIRQTALIPIKIASFASGVVIGTPIAIARCEAKRMDMYAKSFDKEFQRNDNWITPTMAASIPGQTLRVAGTVAEGALNGVGNALLGSLDEPFSQSVYSLKKLETLD
ncbi:MAG: hypothetical protein K2Y39_08450 [Candidatus Obscuribacterales bacterium]|nr:hypothetical protein [Candidatus Obscuribacterales bacterium]